MNPEEVRLLRGLQTPKLVRKPNGRRVYEYTHVCNTNALPGPPEWVPHKCPDTYNIMSPYLHYSNK